ncbi:hypothetical protein DSO57_1008013 [Entomophthora muscae]|uniref:Uncharacterized protein n=1 Tax=Entomophthora muscae TaxID=34485 RepID=A0ACC2USI2_9FUNG|nr:hypothetical protein DSO57_1008013 [Entomophthora muscae]
MMTFHDAFWLVDKWEYLAKKPKVMLDTHYYNVFDKYLVTMNHRQHLNHLCELSTKLERSKSLMPTFVSEWSLASTDCTHYLNEFMKGLQVAENFKNHESPRLPARYNFNNNKCAQYNNVHKFPKGQKQFLKKFFKIQIRVYEIPTQAGSSETSKPRTPRVELYYEGEEGVNQNPQDNQESLLKRIKLKLSFN